MSTWFWNENDFGGSNFTTILYIALIIGFIAIAIYIYYYIKKKVW
ncbi:MAG: hypothetical protein QXI16_00215 [Sulfolobaceae archaeon]